MVSVTHGERERGSSWVLSRPDQAPSYASPQQRQGDQTLLPGRAGMGGVLSPGWALEQRGEEHSREGPRGQAPSSHLEAG